MSEQTVALAGLVPHPRPSFKVLGVRVDAVQIPDVVQQMRSWINARQGCQYIAVTGMHGVSESQHDPILKSKPCRWTPRGLVPNPAWDRNAYRVRNGTAPIRTPISCLLRRTTVRV